MFAGEIPVGSLALLLRRQDQRGRRHGDRLPERDGGVSPGPRRDRLRRRLAVRGVEAPTLLLSGASGTWSVTVPRTLLTKTCTAALADACFNPAAGLVSARVITLAQGAMRTMFWTKMKLVAIGMAATVLSLGGMGLAARAYYGPAEADEPAAGLVSGGAQAEEQLGRPSRQPPQGAAGDASFAHAQRE